MESLSLEEMSVTVPTCDFCGIPYVKYWYPCRAFDVNAVAFLPKIGTVEGPVRILDAIADDMTRWGACHDCSRYIDREDYFFLAQRITRLQETPQMFGPILSLFHEFQRMRIGDRQDV